VTYVVTLVVLSILVGGLGYLWLGGSNAPPSFEVEAHFGDIEQRNSVYHLTVSVTNQGDQSAQEVVVEVAFGEESRSFVIALIPGGATRSGTVVFTENPVDREITTEVTSFITS